MEYKKLQLEKFSSAFFLWFSLVALFLLSYYEIAFFFPCCYCCLVTQFRLTLFDPLDCSPPGFSVHGISQARILEWVCCFLPQGIFLTQGSNLHLLHLLHCRGNTYMCVCVCVCVCVSESLCCISETL